MAKKKKTPTRSTGKNRNGQATRPTARPAAAKPRPVTAALRKKATNKKKAAKPAAKSELKPEHGEVYLGPREYKVLGTRPIRHDGVDKVTGRAVYGADLQLSGMIHGRVLRSPHAHARIVSIDTSAAEQMPGVYAVATAADLPDLQNKIADLGEGAANLAHLGDNVLAHHTALYKGHAVAGVAAASPQIAEEALKLIRVEYEPLPVVLDMLEAMQADAPVLHADLRTKELGKPINDSPTNVDVHFHFEQGDVERGFAQADVVIEREFRTATVHQGYIEPHVATAMWNRDGHLTVWTSTQGAFTCRQQTAEILQMPVSKVTVIPCEIGGGFGGKITVYLEPVAAILSRKSGRPVKMVMNRAEVFEGTGPTPASFVRMKIGASKDGRITAADAWLAYDAGAYPGGFVVCGAMCVFACYDLPSARVHAYDVCVNKPKSAAYRAPGATQAAFACESVMDELAERLGIDPIEFRLRNSAKAGTRRVDGPVYPRIGAVETLVAARASEHYQTPLVGANRGRGVATGFWFNAALKSSVAANVNLDGSVTLVEGSTDIGGTRTSVAMQLAEALGIAAEDVVPRVVDTDSVGYTDVTGGSRVTFCTGLAAYRCAQDIERQMRERAALLWDCKPEEVKVENGQYRRNGKSLSFKELAGKLHRTGGPVVGRATVDPEGSTNGFATQICDVEVDSETGKTTVLRWTIVQDAGKAIHPSYVEGQMSGGAVQGIGWALNEEYLFDDRGQMTNASFLDYRMPTALDVPMIETVIVEVPNPSHPYGVRGVGEVPIVAPPAALANAIYQAVGVRMRELPMSPPRVWKALDEARRAGENR
ncbi:MAG: xanthine dehydrogenase family protein molybdopterin-binding subunit [Pirellulales bacterium]|nr:xanthine dehydrogenase family protein molybdopterin-binding subunit [Pirellulales bacterium]